MAKALIHLFAGVMLIWSSGCAKNSGSLTAQNPFEAGSDPFQAAHSQTVAHYDMNSATTNGSSKPGWSRTGQTSMSGSPSQSSPGFSHVGLASQSNSLRFQSSAPIPEITAESPQTVKTLKKTVEAPAMPEIQQVEFVEEVAEESPFAPASYETTMPKIRPRELPDEAQESPVSIEMSVFVADEFDGEKEPAESVPESSGDDWWKQ